MEIRNVFVSLAALVISVFWMSGAAFAFCGQVQASATGGTRDEAISIANNKGLRETRRLDSNYGGNVHYNPARVNCQESHTEYYCNISQKFCVDGAQTQPARGEEGSRGQHGCPRGTRPVPETDNCIPIAEHNENNRGCKGWRRACADGDRYSCTKYETTCQND
ncbi:MAG: hypothetical protein CTY15_06570 [Methylocystis sp.]|nr:MAG: hypothetical protein CTY15_06570 [Methylocystis sp.]